MRTTLHPINPDKLKSLINEHGGIVEVSYHTKTSANSIYFTMRRGTISNPLRKKLDFIGIKYEDYKPEEPKPEPKPDPETKIVTRDEMFMKSVVAMLSEICNNQKAMSGKIDELIRLWGED